MENVADRLGFLLSILIAVVVVRVPITVAEVAIIIEYWLYTTHSA